MGSTPEPESVDRLAVALTKLLPISGPTSLQSVAVAFGIEPAHTSDPVTHAQDLISRAQVGAQLGNVVRAAIEMGVASRREAGDPVGDREYAQLTQAADVFGLTVPPFTEIGVVAEHDKDTERTTRLMDAMSGLYAGLIDAPDDDRMAKLANVLGGLLRAHDAEILRAPGARDNDIRGVIRMGGIEYLIHGVWDVGDDPLAVDTSDESLRSLDRRILIVAIQGFPRNLRPHPEHDRRKVLLDGRDLSLLLEGRWTLAHAVRWKTREQRETRAFAQLPMSPPEDDPTAMTWGTRTRTGEDRRDADRSIVAANTSEFDQTVAEEIAASQSEQKRMRRLGIAMAALFVAILAGLFINARAQDAINSAELETASNTAMRAAQAQQTAYERLETTGLERYFADSVINGIQAQIQNLRENGVYVTATIEREIIPEGSLVEGTRAQIVFRETGATELRGTGDGRILRSDPAHRLIHGFLMGKEESGSWLVIDWTIFDSE